MEVNVIKLEDGCNYLIVDTIEKNKNKYLVLVKEGNELDFIIRRVYVENGNEWLVKLDTYEEFKDCMSEYINKYRKEEETNEG